MSPCMKMSIALNPEIEDESVAYKTVQLVEHGHSISVWATICRDTCAQIILLWIIHQNKTSAIWTIHELVEDPEATVDEAMAKQYEDELNEAAAQPLSEDDDDL